MSRTIVWLLIFTFFVVGTGVLPVSAWSQDVQPVDQQESLAKGTSHTVSPDAVSPVSSGPANITMLGARVRGTVADGVFDDTSAIQAAVDALPLGGTVDGGGHTYLVGTITLKSDMTFANFNLITKAGSEDFVSPVTIGSNSTPDVTSDVAVRNVHVDGNRINQTHIGDSEDGGRHGFRVVGHVTRLLIDGCSATRCASDGLLIYSGLGGGSFPRATNIVVKDSSFTWNRRHGCSGDAIDGAQFMNVEFNDNGQDLNTTDPLDSGARGDRSEGRLYGDGVDMEGYGVGSANRNISFRRVTALRNVRIGIHFYDTVAATDAGFGLSRNIIIADSTVDCGNGTGSDGQLNAIEFTSTPSHKALGPIYTGITLSDNIIRGWVCLRAVDSVTISGGEISNPEGMLGNLDYATNVTISMNRGNHEFYTDHATVTYLALPVQAMSLSMTEPVSIARPTEPVASRVLAPASVHHAPQTP